MSFLSKLLEKCALVRFNNHCKENDLMPLYQSAYREHHSCETALVRLTNDLLWNMEMQWVMALVAIDLSAAFNTVDHTVLLKVFSATLWSIWQGAELDGHISKTQRLKSEHRK